MRPRGTPPTPRAMSRGSAPVEIASTSIAPTSPSFIRAPCPKFCSICLTATCSAWSRAFASFSPASLKLGFSAIGVTSQSFAFAVGRKLQLGQRFVLRAAPAQMGLEEHQTSRTEEPEHVFGQRVRLGADQGGFAAPRRLRLYPRDRQVRPEGPLLRLVEARLHQPLLHLLLQGHRLVGVRRQRDQPRALALRE